MTKVIDSRPMADYLHAMSHDVVLVDDPASNALCAPRKPPGAAVERFEYSAAPGRQAQWHAAAPALSHEHSCKGRNGRKATFTRESERRLPFHAEPMDGFDAGDRRGVRQKSQKGQKVEKPPENGPRMRSAGLANKCQKRQKVPEKARGPADTSRNPLSEISEISEIRIAAHPMGETAKIRTAGSRRCLRPMLIGEAGAEIAEIARIGETLKDRHRMRVAARRRKSPKSPKSRELKFSPWRELEQ